MNTVENLFMMFGMSVAAIICAYAVLPNEITETWTLSDMVFIAAVQTVCASASASRRRK